jgi:REP element-mobilizing transposase RayT
MKYVNKLEELEFGKVYHIYNKAISNDLLFRKEDDYYFFLRKLEKFILPIAEIYAYCLIPNHFHLLLYIRPEDNIKSGILKRASITGRNPITQAFANFFNSYSKSYNIAYNRMGRLFLYPFKRILVDKEDYLLTLINYIHRNPIHHGIVKNFSEWKYSSYNTILSNKPTKIERAYIIQLLGSKKDFVLFHEQNKTKPGMDSYSLE